MNKSQMAKLAAAAGMNGLMYDPNAEGVFGNVQGYTVTIMPNANNRVYYMLSLSVSRMGMAPNPADFKPLEKMNKVLSGCTVQRFRVNFLVKLSGNKDKMAEALHSALDTLITFLRTNGYTNCCEHCGRPEGVDAYTVSGNAYLLCEPCFGQVSEAAAQQNQTKMQKQEQVLPGIVGALIGSLIGAVVIVIVGQLGYVAAVSGLVMAICTLKGYEMLGKKLGTPGIIISCVLMLLMIFLAYQADWSITAAQFYETDFFTAFRAMMDLIKEGYVDSGDYFGGPCTGLSLRRHRCRAYHHRHGKGRKAHGHHRQNAQRLRTRFGTCSGFRADARAARFFAHCSAERRKRHRKVKFKNHRPQATVFRACRAIFLRLFVLIFELFGLCLRFF